MPAEFMGVLLEYFLDDPTGEAPQLLEAYSKETKAEFLVRFKQALDEKEAHGIEQEEIELETKVYHYIKKQSELFFDEFIEEQKILYAAPQKETMISLPKKEKKTPDETQKSKAEIEQAIKEETNQAIVQAQKDFQRLKDLFKMTAINCLLSIEKLKKFLRLLPYFHERSLEENLYIFLQEPAAIHLRESSQVLGFLSKNQSIVMFPCEPSKENGERLMTYYRAEVSKKELKFKVKDKESFSYLISQLIKRTNQSMQEGAAHQKRFEYLAVCFAYGIRENTLPFFERNHFFLEETDPKLLELCLQNILNEIHLIQEKLSKIDSSNLNKEKSSQELLHEKLKAMEKKQKQLASKK
ncbi:hypothetical protein [Lactococcus lactis]